jgi:hypothetical protein
LAKYQPTQSTSEPDRLDGAGYGPTISHDRDLATNLRLFRPVSVQGPAFNHLD